MAASSLPLIRAKENFPERWNESEKKPKPPTRLTLGMKEATVSTSTNRVDNVGFKIDVDGARSAGSRSKFRTGVKSRESNDTHTCLPAPVSLKKVLAQQVDWGKLGGVQR